MADIIVGLTVAIIIFLALRYIYVSKKKGKACVGCPSSGSCPYKNNPAPGCSASKYKRNK